MTRKAFRCGTHRVRHPEQTWEAIAPLLPDYGITRVADVTGLDVLGVPVAMAVRPLARTLTVSQGKGQMLLLAKISAAMEALEIWHAEFHHPRLVHRQVPARGLDLPYRIGEVTSGAAALVTDATPVDWVEGVGLGTGGRVPVPAGLVTLAVDHYSWSPPGLRWSTNGLASGNSRAEAALHALYEVVERDAVSRRAEGAAVAYVEPDSVLDRNCADVIERVVGAGAALRIIRVPSRFDVPCFGATVWSRDFPVTCFGWGAHLDAGVAVSRAVTEAVQSRLTAIVGSRDDLPPVYQQVRSNTDEPPPVAGAPLDWADARDTGPGAFDDLDVELAWLSGRIAEVTGVEPLCVELSTVEQFAVVKVLVPGSAFDDDRVHSLR